MSDLTPLGAVELAEGGVSFCVWAPNAGRVALHVVSPLDRRRDLDAQANGYHTLVMKEAEAGWRYFYSLDGRALRPDPCSRYQPLGVHGPSEVVQTMAGVHRVSIPLADYVLYELHVGTFSPEGTFAGVIPRLPALRELGVTALELMPVAQFTGTRNWGYDGVYPYAVQDSYGGPEGLRALAQACHEAGMAIVLDVVYNHVGPEGSYLVEFGPYFTGKYATPWGAALNFDGPGSDEVRRYFVDSALYFIRTFGVDALRVDATHSIVDASARPFQAELTDSVRQVARADGRNVYLIAESDLNDPRVITPTGAGGLGFDAQWADDLHHSLHVALTGESEGYYADYDGLASLATAYGHGYVYHGQYSGYRRRRHGTLREDISPAALVVCAQDHDQVGNRFLGERLSSLLGPDRLRLAAGAAILSPFLPLLFMGEEYGETAPFLYFIDHSDPELLDAVRRGRRQELDRFPDVASAPDPADPRTFEQSTLRWPESENALWRFYRELLRLRRDLPGLRIHSLDQQSCELDLAASALVVRRGTPAGSALIAFNFGDSSALLPYPLGGDWRLAFDSAGSAWQEEAETEARPVQWQEDGLLLAPRSFVVLGSEATRTW